MIEIDSGCRLKDAVTSLSGMKVVGDGSTILSEGCEPASPTPDESGGLDRRL